MANSLKNDNMRFKFFIMVVIISNYQQIRRKQKIFFVSATAAENRKFTEKTRKKE